MMRSPSAEIGVPANPMPGWIVVVPMPSTGPAPVLSEEDRIRSLGDEPSTELAWGVVVRKGPMPYVLDQGDEIEEGYRVLYQDQRYARPLRADGYVYLPMHYVVAWESAP